MPRRNQRNKRSRRNLPISAIATRLHLDASQVKAPSNPPPVTLTPWYPLIVVIPTPKSVNAKMIVDTIKTQLFLEIENLEFRLRRATVWGDANSSSYATMVPYDLMDQQVQDPRGRFSDFGDPVRRATISFVWSRAEQQQALRSDAVKLAEISGATLSYWYILWRTVVKAGLLHDQLSSFALMRVGKYNPSEDNSADDLSTSFARL